jgi:hypothetical protein
MTTEAAPRHARLTNDAACNTASDVIQALQARTSSKTLRRLAFELGQNVGTLSAVMRRKRKPSPALYIALGLTPPARLVEVPAGYGVGPACKTCGEVHTTTMCPTKRKPRKRYVGIVTEASYEVNCIECNANSMKAITPIRRLAIQGFLKNGWIFTDEGPLCKREAK